METILNLQQVSKIYNSGNRELTVLDNVNFPLLRGWCHHQPPQNKNK